MTGTDVRMPQSTGPLAEFGTSPAALQVFPPCSSGSRAIYRSQVTSMVTASMTMRSTDRAEPAAVNGGSIVPAPGLSVLRSVQDRIYPSRRITPEMERRTWRSSGLRTVFGTCCVARTRVSSARRSGWRSTLPRQVTSMVTVGPTWRCSARRRVFGISIARPRASVSPTSE